MTKSKKLLQCAVILAGGRGTRFWPRSRNRTPKQLLNIVSAKSMLRETADRLEPLFSPNQTWIVTNVEVAAAARRELPRVPRQQILAEPMGRNTAAAIGLAAIHLAQEYGDAVMAVLPADHYIGDTVRYRRIVRSAMTLAARPGNLVVLGIPPTRPDTGFGYVERGNAVRYNDVTAYAVKRFTEKPSADAARRYAASTQYFWNGGMFFFRVSTFLECLRKFMPRTWSGLGELQQSIGTAGYSRALARIYSRLENISVDYAVMEPASRGKGNEHVFMLPARVDWSDIGSWAAVYELLARKRNANVSEGESFTFDASGNFLWSAGKFIAAIGVQNLVIVDTGDALLVCPRNRAQDVGKIVKYLEEKHRADLL